MSKCLFHLQRIFPINSKTLHLSLGVQGVMKRNAVASRFYKLSTSRFSRKLKLSLCFPILHTNHLWTLNLPFLHSFLRYTYKKNIKSSCEIYSCSVTLSARDFCQCKQAHYLYDLLQSTYPSENLRVQILDEDIYFELHFVEVAIYKIYLAYDFRIPCHNN